MTVNPIQPNMDNTKVLPYRESKGAIPTTGNVKPLPAQGHLVHDRIMSMPRFFIKDFMYDVKAVKDGFNGTANDHELGRLNDVGVKVAGIGIATYLASRTSNPVARVMEYAGLGAFLAAMSIYPKLAIQLPSRVLHGFDSGKEYIDDQGRKKSVFQDQNYIPFDMYRGEYADEDLDKIGDALGVPKDAKNRHELVKEQMRKISIQNNTLWMLTAGFATPVIAALFCVGLEKLISPAMEKARNIKHNSKISTMLKKTEQMLGSEPKSNSISSKSEKILKKYEGKNLPKEEFEKLLNLFTENLDSNTAAGVKEDLANILGTGDIKAFYIADTTAEKIVKNVEQSIPLQNRDVLKRVFVPSKDEISGIINKYKEYGLYEDKLPELRAELKSLFEGKINNENSVSKEYLQAYRNNVIEEIINSLKKNTSQPVTSEKISTVSDFAKIIGEFKQNQKALDKCKVFKFEDYNNTELARAYSKFETTLLEVLDIKFADLKKMKESENIVKEVLDDRLTKLAKDDVKYQKSVKKLAGVISDMEIALNGNDINKSHVKDLVTAIENNYNNTAKRLNQKGNGKFAKTIDRLVKEDVSTLSNSLSDRADLFNWLDGVKERNIKDEWSFDYAKENGKGAGSSKNLEISKILERYQGVKNSFNRVIHTMDIYKRFPDDNREIIQKGKEALLTATSGEHTLKLNTVNSPEFYKDVMNTIWNDKISDSTANAIGTETDLSKGNVLVRFKTYIEHFRKVIGNNDIDYTKPNHKVGGDMSKLTEGALTRNAKFNLVAQSPVEFLKKSSERIYNNKLWMRRVSAIGGSVLGITLLAQLGFGQISNKHNIQRYGKNIQEMIKEQVSYDTDNKN